MVLARQRCWSHSQASRRYGTERLDLPGRPLRSRTQALTARACNAKCNVVCHSDFGPGDFGPAGPKSPENTAGISVRGTIITRDIGPGPDILVRVADLRLGSYASAVVAYTQPLA